MTRRFMLDTDVASYLIRGQSLSRTAGLQDVAPHLTCLSAVTHGELRSGLARNPTAHRLARAVELFLGGIETLPWDTQTADRYGIVRADLERRGRPIGALDQMIAAQALATDATLITRNTRHFGEVDGLRILAWKDQERATLR